MAAAAEHELIGQIYHAKQNPDAADVLIRQYKGFIRSETSKFTHQSTENGCEDELSISMLAFYECILGYERSRGAFLSYASRAIRNRLIDYYRREKRHRNVLSLNASSGPDEENSLIDTLQDGKDEMETYEIREASQKEIEEFGRQLAEFGLSFSDVADNCPRQERTLTACRRVLRYAVSHPELLERFVKSKKLPLGELASGSGTDKKTMERHRKYLAATLLAFTNGYELIRGHLCQLIPN